MNDEWRLRIDLHEEDHAQALTGRLDARELEHDLSGAFHDRVVVTRDGTRVFVYAATREQSEKACRLIEGEASEHGWHADIQLRRWHSIAEDWEDPEREQPGDEAGRSAEREALMAREREETAQRGYPEFEVRVDLPSHHDAASLAEQLRKEGLPAVRRWKYLLVGAADEDSAKALAGQIQDEAPAGSRLKVEGTWAAAYGERPPNPFAVFGGLGG